ncbi:MAG: hypothetical protein D4S01_08015 [Dehalococcoidia bacterium]|nr:MAG: hypothetical protein D4S01_08015 [Dehalococcoidia bacterium]
MVIEGGESVISNNAITGGGYHRDLGSRLTAPIGALDIRSSSAVISANVITGSGIRLSRDCGSLVITNNTITSGIFCSYTTWDNQYIARKADSFEISGNVITGEIEVKADTLSVSNNKIMGTAGTGIQFSAYGEEITSITGNMVSGCSTGIYGSNANGIVIENNLIVNNTNGIMYTGENLIIQNNTIANNTIGIYGRSSSVTISYNNIENNNENSIYLQWTSSDIDATYNWWGTTHTQAINMTIYDYKYDFDLGTVTFVPFLTEPNPEAMPISEFPSWVILPLLLTVTLRVILCKRRLAKTTNNTNNIRKISI